MHDMYISQSNSLLLYSISLLPVSLPLMSDTELCVGPDPFTPVAGPIFETENRAIFSGELFSGEEFRETHYLSATLFPLLGCGVDSYLSELEHL